MFLHCEGRVSRHVCWTSLRVPSGMETRMVSKSLASSDSSLSIELTSCLLSRLGHRFSGSGFGAFAVEC